MDRLRLNSLSESVLSLMPALTHVYLQHNNITTMTPLAVLPALSFCALSYNRIEEVRAGGEVDVPMEEMMLPCSRMPDKPATLNG